MARSKFDALCSIVEALGCELQVDTRGARAVLTIWSSDFGTVVSWTAYSGSSEEAASFALASTDRIQELVDQYSSES
jgi:hypothetical protein